MLRRRTGRISYDPELTIVLLVNIQASLSSELLSYGIGTKQLLLVRRVGWVAEFSLTSTSLDMARKCHGFFFPTSTPGHASALPARPGTAWVVLARLSPRVVTLFQVS